MLGKGSGNYGSESVQIFIAFHQGFYTKRGWRIYDSNPLIYKCEGTNCVNSEFRLTYELGRETTINK